MTSGEWLIEQTLTRPVAPHYNSSFTDFPLIKPTSFLRRTHEVAPGNNTGYSYAHARIAQIKNAREHCVHVTDHFGWRFSTMHVMKYRHCNECMYTFRIRINAKLVKEGSFRINAKLVKEELSIIMLCHPPSLYRANTRR